MPKPSGIIETFMELTHACRNCGKVSRVGEVEHASTLVCPDCGDARSVSTGAFATDGLHACACCGTEDLYTQKDFPQALGLTIVITGFAVSSVFWYLERPLVTYAILLASGLLDMVMFYKVPNVTICYRCLSQFRGIGSNPEGRYTYFDLAIGERYRQERMRVEEHRKRERDVASGEPPASV